MGSMDGGTNLMANTNTCNCCGCVLVDGTTSVVAGSGSSSDPFKIDVVDPLFSVQRFAVRRQRSTSQSIPNDTLTEVDFTVATAGPASFNLYCSYFRYLCLRC